MKALAFLHEHVGKLKEILELEEKTGQIILKY